MATKLDAFIEEYRQMLRAAGNMAPDWNADHLRERLEEHRDRWAGDPEGRVNWQAFEDFISSDLPMDTKWREWAHVLGGVGRPQ